VDWIQLTQDTDKWRALVSTTILENNFEGSWCMLRTCRNDEP